MKRSGYAIMAAVLTAAILSACGSTSDTSTASVSDAAETVSSAASETAESNTDDAEETQAADGQDGAENSEADTSESSNALIVYFDYSENMGDTSGMSMDAITSASLAGESYDGITTNDLLVMKDEIQKQTGADVFSVRVTEAYDPDYDDMVGVAQEDQNNNKQFTFVEDLPDLDSYNVIYMGMPVWWGGLPQPMVCLLDQYDFSGKTIVPFGIHLGSRFGRMIDQIEEAEPDATVIEDGLTENSHTPNAQVISNVDSWLEGLNLEN